MNAGLNKMPQFLCRFGHRGLRMKDGESRFHHSADRAFRESLIAHPLLAHLGRSRRNDLLTAFARKAFEDILGKRWIQKRQHLGDEFVRCQHFHRFPGSMRHNLGKQRFDLGLSGFPCD